MKIVNFTTTNQNLAQAINVEGNVALQSPTNNIDSGEMRIAFFSKGNIYLDCGAASFKIEMSEGLSLAQTDCFGQLISNDFEKLFSECTHFRYNGSPVKFTVHFYNKNNQLLAKLISDSIFKNIGFGRGEGNWELLQKKY